LKQPEKLFGRTVGDIQHGGHRHLSVTLGSDGTPVSEHMTYEVRIFSVGDGQGDEGMTKVMYPDVFQYSITPQPLPRLLDPSEP
jgi:hypothetical protein